MLSHACAVTFTRNGHAVTVAAIRTAGLPEAAFIAIDTRTGEHVTILAGERSSCDRGDNLHEISAGVTQMLDAYSVPQQLCVVASILHMRDYCFANLATTPEPIVPVV